jgi:hypothetical protein
MNFSSLLESNIYYHHVAGTPPTGVKPNFINPPNHDALVISLNTILLTLVWTAVLLRLYAKGTILHTMGWDDCKLLRFFLFMIPVTRSSTF